MDFYEVFRSFYPDLLFYGSRMVGEENAEDVLQDIFIEYWKRAEALSEPLQIKAWLYRALYNRCLNIIKHKKVVDKYSEAMQLISLKRMEYYNPDSYDTSYIIENKELRRKIFSAISELPEKSRAVFVMSYLQDMPSKEIASVLNISQRTVDAHIYKSLKFLRHRLAGVLKISELVVLAAFVLNHFFRDCIGILQ